MIPVRLDLNNFMCYGEGLPPLDFRAVHTACISGDNGNGKSALIDAITWALWGQARARSNDDLVRSGQREMRVEFDFLLSGDTYRVIRRYARPKGRAKVGRPLLELQIQADDGFHAISGNTMTETQQKIKDILHLDYDTFINSALMLQGRANEFTAATPVRRKEVLAAILGLGYYDRLAERARTRVRELEDAGKGLSGQLTVFADELASQAEYETGLKSAEKELQSREAVAAAGRKKLDEFKQRREAMRHREQLLAELERMTAARRADREIWEARLKNHREKCRAYAALRGKEAVINEGNRLLEDHKKTLAEMDRRQLELASLEKRRHQLQEAISQAGESLNREHAVAQGRIREREARAAQVDGLKRETVKAEAELRLLSEAETKLAERRKARDEDAMNQRRLEESIKRRQEIMAELEEKIKLLRNEDVSRCPLCESELGADHIHLIRAKYENEIGEIAAASQAERVKVKEAAAGLAALGAEIAVSERELAQRRGALQGSRGALRRQVQEAEEAAQQLEEETRQLVEIERRMAAGEFARRERQALAELTAQMAAVGYDETVQQQARRQIKEAEHFAEEYREFVEACRRQPEEERAREEAAAACRKLAAELERDEAETAAIAREIEGLAGLRDELALAEAEYQVMERELQTAQRQVARAHALLENCREMERKRRRLTKEIREVNEQSGIYRDLAEAFGKRGVPALLIETAVPEIEFEANRLLQRMTDNRMSLKIETQRATRAGTALETLDINIADEVTRNYETFSGGEAFRIDFALRIALARLLAKRAGAPLPTLIVDEGFGTQDRDGIAKLKEAIGTIQDDFEKILVVTHMEELKDAFPVRLEVSRGEDGATYRFA